MKGEKIFPGHVPEGRGKVIKTKKLLISESFSSADPPRWRVDVILMTGAARGCAARATA